MTPDFSTQFFNAVAVSLCLALLTAMNANAQDESTEWERTEISSTLDVELRQTDGQDDVQAERDTGRFRTDLTLELRQQFSEASRFVAQLELRAEYLTEDEIRNLPESDDLTYELERFYYQRFHAKKAVRWRLGRQNIDDLTGSAIDENLDGFRLTVEGDTLQLDLSFTRQDWIRGSSEDRDDEIYNALVQLTFRPTQSTRWMPFALYRKEYDLDSGNEDSRASWVGIQGVVRPSEAWRYWIHAATRDGTDTDDDESLGGVETNFGLSWSQQGRFKPVYTLGYARASSDYRQSGLHSNEFRINRKNRFQYLGEALDPELANLQVITLSMGIQPAKQWRGDIALHTYQQIDLEDNIRGSDLEFDPDGINKDIGTALDMILSYQRSKQLEILLKTGMFEPGSAFSSDRSAAWIAGLEIEYEF